MITSNALRYIEITQMRTKPFIKLRLARHRLLGIEIDLLEELLHVLQHLFLAGDSTGAILGINAKGVFASLLLEQFLGRVLSRGRKASPSTDL
jgi:hypothetical protein